MKKTQVIELINRIKESRVAFIAIVMFVTFGMALFLGIGWSGSAIKDSLDLEFENNSFYDYIIYINDGIDDNGIKEIENKLDSSSVEGSKFFSAFFYMNDEKKQAKIEMITDKMNTLSQLEGRIPKASNEIAIEKTWAEKNNINIGDEIKFELGDYPILNSDSFVVTCLCENPMYVSALSAAYETSEVTSTQIDSIMFVPKASFNDYVYKDYKEVFIRLDCLRGLKTYSSEYTNKVNLYKDKVDEVIKSILGEDKDYILFTRENNASFTISKVVIDMFDTIKVNMALIFLVIAILVLFSTVSRLVYKDTIYLGTKKALGLSKKEITISYIVYSFISVFIGSIFGMLIARFPIEKAFTLVLNKTYLFNDTVYYFSFKEFITLFLIEAIFSIFATLIACNSTLKKPARLLLNGEEVSRGKERLYQKSFLWNRMSILKKSIVNNFFTDKRRVVSTLIGIVGSTSLIVCAISFDNAINKSFDYQFNELQDYKAIISFDSRLDLAKEKIEYILDKEDLKYTGIYSANIRFDGNGKSVVGTINVTDSNFDNLFRVKTEDKFIDKLEDGVYLSNAFATTYNLKKGDTLKFVDENSISHEMIVSNVYEFYMQCPKILMSKETYEKEFNKDYVENTILLDIENDKCDILNDKLDEIDGYLGINKYYDSMKATFSVIVSVSKALLIIYLVLSFLMAIFVLLDLLIMFIEERKREIITMIINGYEIKDTKKYIYFDTIVLTIIGIIIGVILGVILGKWNVSRMTSDVSIYLNEISILAIIIGIVITTLMTIIISKISLKRIEKFKLSDLNMN